MLTRNYNEAAANSGTFSCLSSEWGGIAQVAFRRLDGSSAYFYRVGRQPKCRQCRNLRGTLCAPTYGLRCRCGNPFIYRLEGLRTWDGKRWTSSRHTRCVLAGSAGQ